MEDCPVCHGNGSFPNYMPSPRYREGPPPEVKCKYCDGKGVVSPERATDEAVDEWSQARIQEAKEEAMQQEEADEAMMSEEAFPDQQ